jgi:hypothetical protein
VAVSNLLLSSVLHLSIFDLDLLHQPFPNHCFRQKMRRTFPVICPAPCPNNISDLNICPTVCFPRKCFLDFQITFSNHKFTGYRLCRRPLQLGNSLAGWLAGWLGGWAGWLGSGFSSIFKDFDGFSRIWCHGAPKPSKTIQDLRGAMARAVAPTKKPFLRATFPPSWLAGWLAGWAGWLGWLAG